MAVGPLKDVLLLHEYKGDWIICSSYMYVPRWCVLTDSSNGFMILDSDTASQYKLQLNLAKCKLPK
jgi:hypothetical protein